jgi:hypothetical protein
MICRAPAHRLIAHVDDVALLDEIFRPALAAIRRAHPVGCGLRSAMDQDERVGTALHLWRQYLDVNLALHDVLAGVANVMSADIEVAAFGDGRLIDRRHRQLHLGNGGRAEQRR